jgi:type I restriction enzyme, R subunit
MNTIGKTDRATENRVLALFRGELGCRYLGDWSDCNRNSLIVSQTFLAPASMALSTILRAARAVFL